jgi:hypothetical protein
MSKERHCEIPPDKKYVNPCGKPILQTKFVLLPHVELNLALEAFPKRISGSLPPDPPLIFPIRVIFIVSTHAGSFSGLTPWTECGCIAWL